MFDFSFYELLVFGIIALIVLGPEKLPQAVRTMGTYYSKFRRTVSTLKTEMEAELDLAETRQQMQKELAKIKEAEAQMQKEMAQLRGNMREFKQSQDAQLKETTQSTNPVVTETKNKIGSVPDMALDSHNSSIDSSTGSKTSSSISSTSSTNITQDTGNQEIATSDLATPDLETQNVPELTRPWENMWFLLGDYDRAKRLPPAPLLPNYVADDLLYMKPTPNISSTPNTISTNAASNSKTSAVSPSVSKPSDTYITGEVDS